MVGSDSFQFVLVPLLSLRSPRVLTALSGASSIYSKLCLRSGSWIMFSSLVFHKYFENKFKVESECIVLVIFFFHSNTEVVIRP